MTITGHLYNLIYIIYIIIYIYNLYNIYTLYNNTKIYIISNTLSQSGNKKIY